MVRFLVGSAHMWVHVAFISIDTRNLFSGVKLLEREYDHSFPFKLEVNVCGAISPGRMCHCVVHRFRLILLPQSTGSELYVACSDIAPFSCAMS
jgi:hypothetical protein